MRGIHPIAELVPSMSVDEETALRVDIREHGLKVPVVLYQGKVLDGRHRARCWYDLNRNHDFPTTTFEGSDAEAIDFVRSHNVSRRHLKPSQRAAFEAAVEAFMKPVKGGRPRKTSEDVPRLSPQRAAAKAAGVSDKTIRKAAKVLKAAAPAVVQDLRDGKVSVDRALAISKLPKARQLAALVEPARRAPAKGKVVKLDPQAEAFNRGVEAAAQFVDDNGDDALAHAIRERCLKRRRV